MRIGITAVFAFVSLLLSYGIFVPKQLEAFSLLGAAGTMAGYPLGDITAQHVKSVLLQVILIIVSFAVCVTSILTYLVLVQKGAANISDVVFLGVLLSAIFLSFSYLLPLAKITVDVGRRQTESEHG